MTFIQRTLFEYDSINFNEVLSVAVRNIERERVDKSEREGAEREREREREREGGGGGGAASNKPRELSARGKYLSRNCSVSGEASGARVARFRVVGISETAVGGKKVNERRSRKAEEKLIKELACTLYPCIYIYISTHTHTYGIYETHTRYPHQLAEAYSICHL